MFYGLSLFPLGLRTVTVAMFVNWILTNIQNFSSRWTFWLFFHAITVAIALLLLDELQLLEHLFVLILSFTIAMFILATRLFDAGCQSQRSCFILRLRLKFYPSMGILNVIAESIDTGWLFVIFDSVSDGKCAMTQSGNQRSVNN